MSFDWAKYLDLAKELIRNKGNLSSEEACLRAAISRSYYSAFCTARNHARDKEGFVLSRTGEDHGKVIRHFLRAPDHKRKKIGTDLDRLRIERAKADYDDSYVHLEKISPMWTNRAEEVIRTIGRL